MARPIVPKAARRQGNRIEVRTAAGAWIPYSMLRPDAQYDVRTKCAAAGHVLEQDFTDWLVEFSRLDDDTPTPMPTDTVRTDAPNDSDSQPVEQDSDSDGDDSDSDNDSDGEPSPNNGGEMTIEDIVRRIAGEMDDTLRQEIAELPTNSIDEQQMQQAISNAIANLQTTLLPVTTKIELVRNDHVTISEGIFHKEYDRLVRLVAAGKHTYLPGPPGSGKSHHAEQAATTLGWRFGAISLGPNTPDSRLWGGMDANGRFHEPPLIQGIRYAMEHPEQGFLFCLDEMDNGNPSNIATLNSALANGWTFAPNGDRLELGRNVVFVGCANTYGTGPTAEFSGRNRLDAATLDRFMYLPWDTDEAMEFALCQSVLPDHDAHTVWLDMWRTARRNAAANSVSVFITMRGCLNGASLIAAGFTPDDAMMLTLGNKLPADQWRRVSPL